MNVGGPAPQVVDAEVDVAAGARLADQRDAQRAGRPDLAVGVDIGPK